MGAVGYHLVRSPCLCLYFVSWSWWSLRGRGIISDSCQPSALFGIMFLLGVILRLQKSCCLYSEKQRGDWRWVAGFAPADLKKKKIKFLLHLLEPTCLQKMRELVITRKWAHIAIITLIIAWKMQEKDTHLLDLTGEKQLNSNWDLFSYLIWEIWNSILF